MAKHIAVEAIHRLTRTDDAKRLEIAADLLNLYRRAMALGHREDFTGQDLKTFNLACLVLDNVAGSAPADAATIEKVGQDLEESVALVAASTAALRDQASPAAA